MQNENKNPFDLPRINDNTEKKENNIEMPKEVETLEAKTQEEKKPIIEIPQEYYDKIAAEEKAKKEAEEKIIQDKLETKKNSQESGKFISEIVVNIIIFLALLFVTAKISKYAIIGIPLYIILATFVGTKTNKKESNAPLAITAGGMAIAVVAFLLSAVNEDRMDFWTYFSIMGAIIGIVGGILSKIITIIITDSKNIKGFQALGMILFFIIIIGGPIFAYKKYPEKFYQVLFYDKTVIVAEDEEDYLIKTLKARYDINFTCDNSTLKYHINEHNQKFSEIKCSDKNKNEFIARAISYNESNKEYTVVDNYIDVALLKSLKTNLAEDLIKETNSKSMTILLYPKENCTFIGDCASCDEYYKRYKTEIDVDNQYKVSKDLNLKKYLSYEPIEFVNEYEFKYVITIIGTYRQDYDFATDVNAVLKYLNSNGYKNKYGYIISFMNKNEASGTMSEIYKVTGKTNNENSFKEPKVVNGNNQNKQEQ